MKHMIYRFSKDGHTYSVKGANRFDAQATAELIFGIKLTGATFEEVYKSKVIRSGKIR